MQGRFSWLRLREGQLSWPVRLALLYAGVLLPVLCHLQTFDAPPDAPKWQSGAFEDKLAFTLSGRAGYVFYPLMLYPMICLTMLLFREHRFNRNPAVRFGMYTGIPVAGWYMAMLGIGLMDVSGVLSLSWLNVALQGLVAVGVPLLFWGLIRLALWGRRKLHIPWWAVIAVGFVLYGIWILHAVLTQDEELAKVLVWPFGVVAALYIISLFCAPSWALGVYLGMSVRLAWRYPLAPRFRLIQLMAVVTWLGAFLAACRWAVERSLAEYAKLPLTDPGGCYVASAAAYGHPWLVGSRPVLTVNGAVVRINRQLQMLKVGELALRERLPHVHRVLRRIYDVLGPRAARRLTNPWLADVAYLSLKPAEWAVCVALACGTLLSSWKADKSAAETGLRSR
jgi:hypothetical protein